MAFFSVSARPPRAFEKGGGPCAFPVETAGYVPAKKQIQDMIRAGVKLGTFREARFEFGEEQEVPADYQGDPTRRRNFDLADASQMAREASARLKSNVAVGRKAWLDKRKAQQDAAVAEQVAKLRAAEKEVKPTD